MVLVPLPPRIVQLVLARLGAWTATPCACPEYRGASLSRCICFSTLFVATQVAAALGLFAVTRGCGCLLLRLHASLVCRRCSRAAIKCVSWGQETSASSCWPASPSLKVLERFASCFLCFVPKRPE